MLFIVSQVIFFFKNYDFYFLALIITLTLIGHIIGADLVEYNPEQDINNLTGSVAAKLTKELASKLMERPLKLLQEVPSKQGPGLK